MNALISAAELHQQLNHPLKPLVLDCRFSLADTSAGEQQFQQCHIPGAAYLHLDRDLSGPTNERNRGRHPLPEYAALARKLGQLGAMADRDIVLYDDSRGAYACRAWWLLRYLGLEKIRILNGGWQAWRAQGFATQAGPGAQPDPMLPALAVQPGQLALIHSQQLLTPDPQRRLVDARERNRYLGLEEPIDPIAGHIPGAKNLPWMSATDERGYFLDADQQWARWQQAGLAEPDANTWVYCGSGVTACVNLFALWLTGRQAGLYAGSWSDWCTHVDASNRALRVATGAP